MVYLNKDMVIRKNNIDGGHNYIEGYGRFRLSCNCEFYSDIENVCFSKVIVSLINYPVSNCVFIYKTDEELYLALLKENLMKDGGI